MLEAEKRASTWSDPYPGLLVTLATESWVYIELTVDSDGDVDADNAVDLDKGDFFRFPALALSQRCRT